MFEISFWYGDEIESMKVVPFYYNNEAVLLHKFKTNCTFIYFFSSKNGLSQKLLQNSSPRSSIWYFPLVFYDVTHQVIMWKPNSGFFELLYRWYIYIRSTLTYESFYNQFKKIQQLRISILLKIIENGPQNHFWIFGCFNLRSIFRRNCKTHHWIM